jgi:hypothetical protein
LLTTLLFAGDAGAAPYLTIEGEQMNNGSATSVDTVAGGFSGTGYTTFQGDGAITSSRPVKNAGWLRVRARSNGCTDGTFARLQVVVGAAGAVLDQQLTDSWTDYSTSGFVIDQTGTGTPQVTVSAVQAGGSGICTKQVRLDSIEFYVWRPFSPTSRWNRKASEIASPPGSQTGIQTGPGAWIGAGQAGLALGGCPPGYGSDCMQDRPFNKPICFGESDQSTAKSTTGAAQAWVIGNIAYAGQKIPLASPCGAATGSDGHLAVTNPARTVAYEWWRCVTLGIWCGPMFGYGTGNGGVVARWDLAGSGVANAQNPSAPACCPNRSARGSGTPLISTTIRGEEAVNGIEHVVGCTITAPGSDVSNRYLYPPAVNTDGVLTSGGSRYGELYTLRSNFLADHPSNPTRGRPWSRGELNIINALMTYGCYLVDRHGGFELDTDAAHWTEADWAAADVTKASLNSIQPSDMQYRAISGQTEYVDVP